MREIHFRMWDESHPMGAQMHEWDYLKTWPPNTWNKNTIMQYTGLKDKNDEGSCQVYEHDVLTDETGTYYRVEWDFRDTGWCVIVIGTSQKIKLIDVLLSNAIVIGNIYQNKEYT